jgi:ABC-2 type transport system permease protein
MTWEAVARKDFTDAVRSRALWAVAGLFVALATMLTIAAVVLGGTGGAGAGRRTVELIMFMRGPAEWLIPSTALVVGYKSIAGERETGSIKILLSLPHDRSDVVLGKLAGRTAVVGVAILAGYGLTFLAALVLYPGFLPTWFLGFVGLTLMFSTAFVSIAVGLSAFTASSNRAAAGSFGVFALFTFFWSAVPHALHFVLAGSASPDPGSYPAWFVFVGRLTPNGAYDAALSAFRGSAGLESLLGGPAPVYLSWWVAVLLLAAWIVVPAWVGLRRFETADI